MLWIIQFAKGIGTGAKLYATADIRTGSANIRKENSVALEKKWKGIDILKIDIPADAIELTLGIAAGHNEEIGIDGFTMTLD